MTRIKIALDANIPERTVRMLQSGFGDRGFEFHWEPKFAPAQAVDEFWAIAFKRFGGSVAISGDKNIARRPHQITAFCECGLISFFCEKRWMEQDLAYKCAHLIRWWPTIEETLRIADAGAAWWVPFGLRGELRPVNMPSQVERDKKASQRG